MPLYLPVTTVRRRHTLEVWRCARPAPFASLDSAGAPQTVAIQFRPRSGGAFATLRSVPLTSSSCCINTHVAFDSSGTVRLAWTPPDASGGTFRSRTVQITVH